MPLGSRPPLVEYTPTENEVWSTVHAALAALHGEYAVGEYRRAAARLDLPTDRVPQLADVSDRLTELSGWRLCAVPGLVSTAEFFAALADRCFPSSQYVRHASVPFYTPEPDVIHELIGHANSLASPRIAGLYERAGQVAGRSPIRDWPSGSGESSGSRSSSVSPWRTARREPMEPACSAPSARSPTSANADLRVVRSRGDGPLRRLRDLHVPRGAVHRRRRSTTPRHALLRFFDQLPTS